MIRTRISVLAGTAVLAAAGLGAGVAIAASGPYGQPAAATASPAPAAAASPGYSWYRSMMAGYLGGGGMMGGSSDGWMMSPAGYQQITGGSGAPGWMSGGTLPGSVTGTGTDPGTIMGRLFAGAPGPRISAAQAAALGTQAPADAVVSRAGTTPRRSQVFTGAARPARACFRGYRPVAGTARFPRHVSLLALPCLQVVFPADLAVGISQPQGILGLAHGGRFGRADPGRTSLAPSAQN
jgi:hypothetical protein